MKARTKAKLEELRADYALVTGKPFTHFYCPILFEDEDVPLCEGHIVNEAFRDYYRVWTVQRKDVDNFYGSNFEADFVLVQFLTGVKHLDNEHFIEILSDRTLKRLPLEILVDGIPAEYYIAQSNIPEYFAEVEFRSNEQSVKVVIKMLPEDALAQKGQNWEVKVSRDLRVSALVSLIKMAHLKLFSEFGYRYALSSTGIFIGQDILGKFFRQNHDKPRAAILANAHLFFREFAHMNQEVTLCDQNQPQDRQFLICTGSNNAPWALIVLIKISQVWGAVMFPILSQPDSVATFLAFLQNENETLQVNKCQAQQWGQWTIGQDLITLDWSKQSAYPLLTEEQY